MHAHTIPQLGIYTYLVVRQYSQNHIEGVRVPDLMIITDDHSRAP